VHLSLHVDEDVFEAARLATRADRLLWTPYHREHNQYRRTTTTLFLVPRYMAFLLPIFSQREPLGVFVR
jgi:hypothetical protein